MTNSDSPRARLIELALALSSATSLHDILELSVDCLENIYPGTRWAILDQVAPGRYRSTSCGVSPGALRSLVRANSSNGALMVQELHGDDSSHLTEPAQYSSQVSRPDADFPDLIIGAWRIIKRSNTEALPVADVCRLLQGAVESRRELEKLRNQSIVDELTQLSNRRGILESLSNEEKRLQRYGGALSVLFVDLNYFKEINDTYGHKAGDQALKACAQVMRKVLRASDYVGRFGGDEFLGVLPGLELREAQNVADRMRHAMEQTSLNFGGDTVYLAASVGVASASEGLSGNELVDKADERMYYSKRRIRRVQTLASLETSRRVVNRLSRML